MKRIFIFISLAILSLTLVACGGGGKITFTDWDSLKEIEYDGSKVTIKFWHRMGGANQQIVRDWIKEFNEEYPNITVLESKEADDYPGLLSKTSLNITTGKHPHIVESYPDHVARYGSSVLELDNFINNPKIGYSEEEQADFLSGLWQEGKSYDQVGTTKSLPFSKSSEALYYNKVIFDKYDIELPEKGFWTWEEIFEISATIKAGEEKNAKEGDAPIIPFGYDSSDNLFITGSEQWGAPFTGYNANGVAEVQFNNQKSKDMMMYFKDKVDKGLMLTRALTNAYSSDNMKKGLAPYMFVGSTGGARYSVEGIDEKVFDGGKGYKVGVAPVPVHDGENRKQIQQGPNINIFKKNNPQEMVASWLFSQFMLEPERTAAFGRQSGYAPVRHSAYETDLWTNYAASIKQEPKTVKEAEAKAIFDSIEIFRNNEEIFFTSTVFTKSSLAREQAGLIVNGILASKLTGEELKKLIDREYQDAYDFIQG